MEGFLVFRWFSGFLVFRCSPRLFNRPWVPPGVGQRRRGLGRAVEDMGAANGKLVNPEEGSENRLASGVAGQRSLP